MNNNLNKQVGIRIKKLRKEKSLTRENLAERAEISTQFLADIEAGNKGMSSTTLYKLCIALCVSSDYLLFGNEADECGIVDIIKLIPDNQQNNVKKILSAFVDAIEL